MSESLPIQTKAPHRQFNWSLFLGVALVLSVIALAIIGPEIAPRDPLEEKTIIQINDKWLIPPFPFLTPGYPLGSDHFGRDLYSRLLWGIRPTLVMVSIVAIVRLILGMVIGLLAGWSGGGLGRRLDAVIQGALAVPVLLVALAAIAIVGVEIGVWAFIIGLSLTGWVETGQQVREQTRIVKGQVYIEAAHALGASNRQILIGHVLRQILPMTAMLFAFEVSSTLMTTAGLGFLGYYIGGDVWVEVADFVSRRISGTPELGQMLATTWAALNEPWAMVATGSTVFLTVLGFNLLGEGFRQSLNLSAVRQRGIVARLSSSVRFAFEQYVSYPLSVFFRKQAVRQAYRGILFFLLGVSFGFGLARWLDLRGTTDFQLSQLFDFGQKPAAQAPYITPTAQPEARGNIPPTATPAPPSYAPSIAWQYEDPSGFSGAPALSPSGDTLYAASKSGMLYALSLDGIVEWQAQLAGGGVGTPAISSDGQIYITDEQGGLTTVSEVGMVMKYFKPTSPTLAGKEIQAVSGATLGNDGALYYVLSDGVNGFMQAVSPSGEDLWVTQVTTPFYYRVPEISPDGKTIFLLNNVFDARNGALLDFRYEFEVLRFFPGADGFPYLLTGNTVIQWALDGSTIQPVRFIEPANRAPQSIMPELGVTAEGTLWKLYTSPGGSTLIILQKLDGTQVGEATFGASKGQLLSLSPELTIYLCGNPSFDEQHAECAAFDARSRLAQWTFKLREHGRAAGGFWKEGRLYLTTTGGMVYAIAENKSQVVVTAEQLPLPESNPPLAPGVVWSYSITETIRSGPEVVADGKIYFLTIENEMHVISAEGHLLNVIPLPAGPFIMEGSWGESYPLWPLIFSDGSMVVISEKQTVYALDAQGNLLWETPLEARPYRYPMRTEQDTFYLTDKKGGLYAFDTRGLRWSFHATVAPYTASGLTIAQDGAIYYTVTNYSNGYLQAVSAEGQGLWATRTKTDMFYDEPLVSPEGRLVFVKDNVFDAQTGELLTIEFPLRVDELIIGMDGHLYLRTDHTITEWRIGEQGFEIVQQAEWGARTRGAAPPYYTVVDKNSAIWLTYGGNIVWIKPDGTVLGVHRRANSSGQVYQPDYENTLLTECNYFALDKSFDCATFTPQAEEPIWKVTIAGLPSHEYTFIQGRYAYVMGKDHMLYKTYLGEP